MYLYAEYPKKFLGACTFSSFRFLILLLFSLETESKGSSSPISPVQIAVTRNMFIVFCAFVLCLTPHAVCTISGGCIIERYTRFLIAINSVINPIIYGLNHPVFRTVFISLLRCKPVPEPSSLYKGIISSIRDFGSSS